jgi:hypothetical protein
MAARTAPGLFLDRGTAAGRPLPDLVLGCGRAGLAVGLAAKRRGGGSVCAVQTQDPRIDPAAFDLVIPPAHDELTGPNVFSILGSPNRVTPERLAEARALWAAIFEAYPAPRAAVLIGGRSRAYSFAAADAQALAEALGRLANGGASLLVTLSRRTGEANAAVLRRALEEKPNVWIWDGTGENPYFGLLAWADAVLVTLDSANMAVEAATAGKPLYLLPLAGGNAKFRRLHAELTSRGIARPFERRLETWTYPPIAETDRAADRIVSLLTGRPGFESAEGS